MDLLESLMQPRQPRGSTAPSLTTKRGGAAEHAVSRVDVYAEFEHARKMARAKTSSAPLVEWAAALQKK